MCACLARVVMADDHAVVVFTYREPVSTGSGMQDVQEEWSEEHAKLLYLISRFAMSARTASDYESWIRHIPILVLLYEGCIAGVLNFDYAPASLRISQGGVSKRLWLNTSQDGKAAIDDLREKNLVNGLKLSTEDFQPVTAYQASQHGMEFVDQIPQRLKARVESFICKRDAAGVLQLLHVEYECLLSPCAAYGVYQPPVHNISFVAVSAFFYIANGIGLVGWDETKGISTAQIAAKADEWCTRSWSADITDARAYRNCFTSTYVAVLLDAYGIPRDSTTAVTYARKIQGFSVTWALGAQIYFRNQ